MRKKVYFVSIFLFIILVSFQQMTIASNPPEISAVSAILLDTKTSQILFAKNMHNKRPPASTTKILTAIVAIEEGNLNDLVTVSKKAAYQEGSSIYLKEEEKLTLEELLYGIMLASGNDAAVAIAEHISGSVEKFARLMNKKAKEIGAKNSRFLNPHGLPQTGHVSTAYDLAMIMRYALQNEIFSRITGTRTIKKEGWTRGYKNHNKLLWSYENTTGGKTGYTKAAGRCLVSSAATKDKELVAVVMNSPGDWVDSTNLFEYGFENFVWKTIVNEREIIHAIKFENSLEDELELYAEDDITILVPAGDKIKIEKRIQILSDIELPVRKHDVIGEILIFNQNQLIGKTKLRAANDLTFKSLYMRWWYRMNDFFNSSF
ncbi:MAG: D-alanyl-D-alanine carboxypeptidase family protein [Halanaerobiaceae bacterium]